MGVESSRSPAEVTPEEFYDATASAFDRLRQEGEFTLKHFLTQRKIKVHSVVSRLKTRESYLGKVKRQETMQGEEPKESFDLAGVRVVCLFLSDLERVGQLLRDEFDVISEDNKILGAAEDVFGYMSVHYVIRFSKSMSGPRYDGLHDLDFEVQVRTILMDAWANVSHYLDYKGEASIPSELRRDFYALSGLFYVADRQFETFSRESGRSAKRASSAIAEGGRDLEVNLNTVEALVRLLFSDRRRAPRNTFGVLAEELADAGYRSMAAVERDIKKGTPSALDIDEANRDSSGRPYLTDLGMARVALRHASADYANAMTERSERRAKREGRTSKARAPRAMKADAPKRARTTKAASGEEDASRPKSEGSDKAD
ncbi:hypothetical protein E4P40_04275 [Blastococcus sp. CT_GayMR20]|uniref:GTP pyrophosphokinase n=1 Tax=Blastococcus sp. CT_GayMR20 TaxID=2559609 RepID=UPI00107332B6|nr:hypothetical protein [Blastococcus sp. CT_GayMR20]TFV91948.1 hypothetical protein E4P40_04120 [Blastococcus sp. CT_GayMR20]TFV91975.1 hypothetical protein E4P40_04275 [Blastococcus sp. CT_GayMR20]